VEFAPDDFAIAAKMAHALGYGDNTAYTSTSALWGLFCMRDSADDPKRDGCIIKTRELGFLFVQDTEDLGFGYDAENLR
jgi:hypothetical protein